LWAQQDLNLVKNANPAKNKPFCESDDTSESELSDRNQVEQNRGQNDLGNSADDADAALAVALDRASAAGQWDIVAQITAELQARRLARSPNVVAIDSRRSKG